MTVRSRLARFLRTPRGVAALLGAALVVSALAATAVALNRGYFERTVRERYPAPTSLLVELGRSLTGAPGDPERVRRLTPDERKALYFTWVQAGRDWPPAAAGVLVAADPELFVDAAFTTLVAGSAEQRRRAVEFLAQSDDPQARVLLQQALDRARRRRERDFAAIVEAAIVFRERRQQ